MKISVVITIEKEEELKDLIQIVARLGELDNMVALSIQGNLEL